MPKKQHSYIDDELARAVFQLQMHEVGSKEYDTILRQVETMHKLREEDHQLKRPSPDTILTVAANLIGIFVIVRHEELNVITSKAMSFLRFR